MIVDVASVMVVCAVQLTDEMLEVASDKRDEAMTAMADGNIFQAVLYAVHELVAYRQTSLTGCHVSE